MIPKLSPRLNIILTAFILLFSAGVIFFYVLKPHSALSPTTRNEPAPKETTIEKSQVVQEQNGTEASPQQINDVEGHAHEDENAPHTHGDANGETEPPLSLNETNIPLTLPDGFRISLFTDTGLGPLRMMAFSPDGILFVSKPNNSSLYSGERAGGAILALPDQNRDGKADEVIVAISGLTDLPHGIAFYNNYLYVAQESSISRYSYLGASLLGAREVLITDLPSGGDGHVSRTIGFSPKGKMYVSVGSSCNICEETDERRAAILEYNPDGTGGRVYASGLRNTVGFDFHPYTGEIWASDNGRDNLGDNIPPDEINLVREGLHYGWPYCYGKKVVDPQFNNGDFCTETEASIFDIQAHSAVLGIRFIRSPQFPPEWDTDLLAAYHGSWNRTEPTGYKIVRLDIEEHRIHFQYDFITGWLLPDGTKLGRPVDLVFDEAGALYISDDKAGVIYRVTKI